MQPRPIGTNKWGAWGWGLISRQVWSWGDSHPAGTWGWATGCEVGWPLCTPALGSKMQLLGEGLCPLKHTRTAYFPPPGTSGRQPWTGGVWAPPQVDLVPWWAGLGHCQNLWVLISPVRSCKSLCFLNSDVPKNHLPCGVNCDSRVSCLRFRMELGNLCF